MCVRVFLLPLFSSVAGVKHLMHLHGVPVSGLGSCLGVGCYTKDLFLALGGNSPLQDHKNAVSAQNGAAILKIKTFPQGFQGFPASQNIRRGTFWGASSKNHKIANPIRELELLKAAGPPANHAGPERCHPKQRLRLISCRFDMGAAPPWGGRRRPPRDFRIFLKGGAAHFPSGGRATARRFH